MSQDDQIRIDLKSDISEGEKARKKLSEIEQQTNELRSSFESGNVTLARYNQELRNLERQADRTRASLEKMSPLTGAKRAGAKFQLGLAGANIAQDVIQGGPAAGVNNILGLAQNNSVRALGGEMLTAVGGVKLLVTALGVLGAAAAGTFVAIDQGLKTNKLGWSDLGSVIDAMAGNKFSETGKVWGETFDAVYKSVASMVGGLADATIGWNSSADAVRRHKDEVERNTAALEAYMDAQKALSGVQSEAQKTAQKEGEQFAKEAADMGGNRGLAGVIEDLARKQAGADADKKFQVETNVKDKDGKETGEVRTEEITGLEVAKRAITQDFAKAMAGDKDYQNSLRKRLGPDAADLGSRDEDRKAEEHAAKFDQETEQKRIEWEEKGRQAEEEEDRKAEEHAEKFDQEHRRKQSEWEADGPKLIEENKRAAVDHAEKLTAGTGLDARAQTAMLRAALASGGATGVARAEVAKGISKELQAKGMAASEADMAAKEMAERHAAKLGDEINEKAMQPEALRKVDHLGAGDYARSIESAAGDSQAKLLETNEAMKDRLTELVKFAQRGVRLS